MNKKNNNPVDPISHGVKLMSDAVDKIQELTNHVDGKMGQYFESIPVTTAASNANNYSICVGSPYNTIVGSLSNLPDTGFYIPTSYTVPPYTNGTVWVDYDFGNWPKVDIIRMKIPEDSNRVNGKPEIRYDINIYIAGILKEEVDIKIIESYETDTVKYASPILEINVEKTSGEQDSIWDFDSYFLKESKHTKAKRVVTLPQEIDVKTITDAKLENGVLSFSVFEKIKKPLSKKPEHKITIK